MRAAFWLLALFALAVAVTLVARLDQGYVIVVFPPWRLEMSFLLTVVVLAGGFVLVSFLLHLARTALRLPEDLRAWRRQRHQAAADLALLDALRAHFAGEEGKLRKQLKKARDCGAQDLLARLQPPVPTTEESKETGAESPQVPG
jgi:HemY protein